jgi:penicillin-binding protein 1A
LLRWGGRIVGVFLGLAVLVVIGGGVAGYLAYQRFSADLPDLDGLRHYQPKVMSRVYAGNSKLIAELATERRIFVPFSAIPDMVKQAFVSAEDQNFWVHRGVDPVAILRAAVTDLQQMGQGRRPIGASTITQQVAKNMLVGNELSLSRKIKEAILATRIEATLSKERILELYLNEIYLGNSSYGVAAAAEGYFNKPLDQLTLADAAFLAALPKAPNNYNPFKFPDAARNRRDWVLDRMMDDHAVTAEAAQQAKRLPVQVAEFRRPETVPGANYFAEDVRRQLVDRFGADQTTQGGLTVRTSLDPGLQAQAELALRAGLMAYDRGHGGWRGPLTHLDAAPTTLKATWTNLLATVPRPPGMLAAWRLALVLETTDSEAKLGWLDTQPQITPLLLSESTWARPLRDGKPGGTPRRITDIMQRRRHGGTHHHHAKSRPPCRTRPAAPDSNRPRCAGIIGSAHRPRARARRRLELCHEPVRPRDPGPAPARQQFQALRLSDRDAAGHHAELTVPRCAVRARPGCRGQVAAEQFRAGLQWSRPAARSA